MEGESRIKQIEYQLIEWGIISETLEIVIELIRVKTQQFMIVFLQNLKLRLFD